VNQIVVEIETAKAAVELPIPWAGVITELHVQPGETVAVGTPILTVDVDPTGAPAAEPGAEPAAPADRSAGEPTGESEEMKPLVGYGGKTAAVKRRARRPVAPAGGSTPAASPEAPAGGHVPLAKPPVRKLARELGVDLRALTGTSPGGVINREDVHEAAHGAANGAPVRSGQPQDAREHRVPVKGVRKATAAAMVASAFTAPHATEFLTVDVTPMMELRARLKNSAQFAGVRLTPLAFAAKALCLAARRTPEVNATWDEASGEIVYKDYVHLGIAADTPRGLVVPKVRDADAMSLRELAEAIESLVGLARDGRTPPEDMTNGTITITNVGVFGVDTGTPILNPGESAILAFGSIRDMPWVVEGQLAVRKVCQLALSFDHRVVDGAQGSRFLADVGALLADPATAITY
ncbi:MAG: dihydrolipoamide acetyltransferase family protein, partial [Sciscionella sp.]